MMRSFKKLVFFLSFITLILFEVIGVVSFAADSTTQSIGPTSVTNRIYSCTSGSTTSSSRWVSDNLIPNAWPSQACGSGAVVIGGFQRSGAFYLNCNVMNVTTTCGWITP